MPTPKPSRAELEARTHELVAHLGVPAPAADRFEALVRFAQLVASWNDRVDLTGAKRASELSEVLLADALVLADPTFVPEGARLVDIGTGVGAPLVPLVLLRPDIRAVAIEPRRKRVTFLRVVVGELDLVTRLAVHEGRVELNAAALPPAVSAIGGAASVACSRATFAPSVWTPLGLRLAPRVLVLGARDDLPTPPDGSRLIAHKRYALPSGSPRQIGVYERG